MAKTTTNRKQIVLRVASDVKRQAIRAAKQQGLSLNAYSEKVLARASSKAK